MLMVVVFSAFFHHLFVFLFFLYKNTYANTFLVLNGVKKISSNVHTKKEIAMLRTKKTELFLPSPLTLTDKRRRKKWNERIAESFREEGGTNNMRLRDQCFEEIVLNLFSILLLEARLWCEYFSLIFNEKSSETFSWESRVRSGSGGIHSTACPSGRSDLFLRTREFGCSAPRAKRTDCKNCLW